MRWSIFYLICVMIFWFVIITVIVLAANEPNALENPAVYGFISHIAGIVCTVLFAHALSEIKYEFNKTTKGD